MQIGNTIQEQIHNLEQKPDSFFGPIWKDMKGMFSGSNLKPQIITMIMMSCSVQLYFTTLYNSAELKGNPLQKMLWFAIAEGSGVFLVTQTIKLMSIPKAVGLYISTLIVLNFIIKYGETS